MYGILRKGAVTTDIAPREKVCFFTGHRVIADGDIDALRDRLDLTLRRLAFRGYTDFVCGGALGFDTFAAERILAAGERDGVMRLVLVLPCEDQTSKWKSAADVERYRRIRDRAAKVIVVSDGYRAGIMHERNRRMADMSSLCVAYFNGRRGGTSYTVGYARKIGLEIINLFPNG